MRVRRALSGAKQSIADPGRSCQHLSITKPEQRSDVVSLVKSNRCQLGITQPARLGVLDSVHIAFGDGQPNPELRAVEFEPLAQPIPADRSIDPSL